MAFEKNRSETSQILTNCRILEGSCAQNLETTLLFEDLSHEFESIHRGNMGKILLAYGLPKVTVEAIIMLYKNHESKSSLTECRHRLNWYCSRCSARRYISPWLFVISLIYVLRTSIDWKQEYSLTMEKARSRRYPEQTITDVNYANDIAILANTPTHAESLLHSLEKVAGGIGLHKNADKTGYMCFKKNQRGDISTSNGVSLKLMDNSTCAWSTENDINTCPAKAWTTIDRLSIFSIK